MKRSWIYFLLFVAAACTEQSTAPGVCPDFCPGGEIQTHDTLFATIIERDSSFRGYLQSYQAFLMTAADEPGVIDSRAFFSSGRRGGFLFGGLTAGGEHQRCRNS